MVLCFAAGLRFFLPVRHRSGEVAVPPDGTSTLGHVVESTGVPLTEVGTLTVDGAPAPAGHRPRGGERVHVGTVDRPQPVPGGGPTRFVLDVHLGALARRMRLVGLDAAYRTEATDPALVEQANAEQRILLTQDRELLHRRALWLGAYVHGSRADAQLADVLERFAPPLAPWSRCTACNGSWRRWRRPTWRTCCSRGRGAPTTPSPAAGTAAGCTGTVRTRDGWRTPSPRRWRGAAARIVAEDRIPGGAYGNAE